MCGFIGFTKKDDILKYKNVLEHRGPDNVDFYKDEYISLLHNRLSIIDINAEANQPMRDNINGNIIVFNGEIYNYKELKNKYNLTCVTSSDTEVILKLYGILGKNFIDELNGIFAFSIYDISSKKILLYRDRFGIKPLYYTIENNKISFASEIKALVSNDIKFDNQVIYDYLEYGLLEHNNNSFFEGILSVDAGHFMEYSLVSDEYDIKRYWDIDSKQIDHLSKDAVIEKTYDLLSDSLRLNLVSDVEVAISLSSGTDSTLITKLAQKYQQKFKAFTFGFEESEYDEVRRIKENFDLSNIAICPVYLRKDNFLTTLKESLCYFETPLGGVGTLSAYNMMKEVKKQNIKVILAGEGSDEGFSGYKYYYPAFFSDIKNTELLEKELFFYNKRHNTNMKINSQEFNIFLGLIKSNKVLAPDGTTANNSHIGKAIESFKISEQKMINKFSNNLNNLMYQDIYVKKLPKLLHFQDRASMANGIEARVPFLDYRIVEFIYSLRSNFKIKNGETKYLLKEILRQKFGHVEKIQTKHYVSTPQREWLKDKKIRDEILDNVRYGNLIENKLINFNKFYTDYTDFSNEKELGNSFFIWKIINLEFLMSSFLEKNLNFEG